MSKYSLKKEVPIISEENAIIEVMTLLKAYDIDVDSMDHDTKRATENNIDKVVGLIMRGIVEVKTGEDGKIKVIQNLQHLSKGATITSLTYGERSNKDHVAMGTEGNEFQKIILLLKSMCETNGGFAALDQIRLSDVSTANSLGALFL